MLDHHAQHHGPIAADLRKPRGLPAEFLARGRYLPALGHDIMTLKTGLFALIAMAAMTSAAMADCYNTGPLGFPRQHGPAFMGSDTNGSPCVISFRSSAVTSASIAARPANGTLSAMGAMAFRYTPKPGFIGVDHYMLHVCTRGGPAPGCWNIHYSIHVH